MADLFNRKDITPKDAITADNCFIIWDGEVVSSAINVAIQYQQGVTRRRSIGDDDAIIYGSLPSGSITISRLLTSESDNIFQLPSWTCKTGELSLHTGSCNTDGAVYTCKGCIVTGFSIQANADDLSVVDNISIEFLQLSREEA